MGKAEGLKVRVKRDFLTMKSKKSNNKTIKTKNKSKHTTKASKEEECKRLKTVEDQRPGRPRHVRRRQK